MKIFHDGMPEWNKRNFTVLSAQSLREGWLDKEVSSVLVDLRPEKEAKAGHIKGAVNLNPEAVIAALKPFKEQKPPIVIYDSKGEGSAEKVATALVKAGFPGPRVLSGGFAAWQGAKLAVEAEAPATKIAYVPKPKAGSISVAEFQALAKALPENVLIVDVRGGDEVEKGMIKGARNIPADEVASRLAEIPKEKELVLHCTTGARAEMAYNILKDKGYKARFLDASITVASDGGFQIK
ncbi:Rhodanese domain protein [Citrifermentans bremense]|uniref:Rhodanese domain protein n=1 Tax=Citrifermentans bremense TaxID=60035 RepID=A0A7R7FSV7_9BACT|nr:Rhodanese domain protein [Citrifermentans bremense]